jgi:hypothetical protein
LQQAQHYDEHCYAKQSTGSNFVRDKLIADESMTHGTRRVRGQVGDCLAIGLSIRIPRLLTGHHVVKYQQQLTHADRKDHLFGFPFFSNLW